jgi:hypothetical protein
MGSLYREIVHLTVALITPDFYNCLVPRRDIYHQTVKNALRTAGWTITHDPLPYRMDDEQIFIDLGAEQVIGAELGNVKIAVEVKSFLSPSPLTDLQEAIGQFVLYQQFLLELEPSRILVLAVPKNAALFFKRRIARRLFEAQQLKVLVLDTQTEVILEWLPQPLITN